MGGLAFPRHHPRRVRWIRRIGGMLGTVALLGAGAAMALMVVGDPDRELAPTASTPASERAAAVALLSAQGYVPVAHDGYDPSHVLRVMIGARGTHAHAPRRAFFFAGETFVGHDAGGPSGSLKVVGSGERWVTLAYGRYARKDRPCCPTRAPARVRFTWTGGTVLRQGTLPPEAQRSP